MEYIPSLKKKYLQEIVPAMQGEFGYKSIMQVPKLEKIVLNQGIGKAVADKKLLETAEKELTLIAGQKVVKTMSKKDISNFKLRKKMPIGLRVTLRRNQMYEFLERLVAVSLPRVRDFQGVSAKFDGRGNYTLGIEDKLDKILGMNITFVTTAENDEEGYALLKNFGIPFKTKK